MRFHRLNFVDFEKPSLIFSLVVLVQFIDLNIGPVPVKSVFFLLVFLYFVVVRKVVFGSPALFLAIFFFYAIYSSIDLLAHTQELSLSRGYMRPLLIFLVVVLQLNLALYLFKYSSMKLAPGLLSAFLILELFLLVFGFLDNSYLKNEKGLHANLLVFLIYFLLRERVSMKFLFAPVISLASTVSSSILAIAPIVLSKKKVVFLVLILLSPGFFWFFHELVISKVELLLSPPDLGTYGGRYWSNLLYIEQIQSNPFFGSGIESLFTYKKENYGVEYFDHGGADFLRLLAEFGIVGLTALILSYLQVHKTIRGYGYRIDFIGLAIVLILSVKGIQIFSHPGMLLMILFAIYRKDFAQQPFAKKQEVCLGSSPGK